MLTQGADIVWGQLLALIDKATDLADPALLLCQLRRGLGLDMVEVVGIGHRRRPVQDFGLGHIGNEQGMGTPILGTDHGAGDVGVGKGSQIHCTVFRPFGEGPAVKLVGIPSGLEAEMLEQLEGHILRQDTDAEYAVLQEHIVGQVGLVHRKGHPFGGICKLDDGVDDAAVVLCAIPGGQDEQAIGQLEHGAGIHRLVVCRNRYLGDGFVNGIHQDGKLLGFLQRGADGDRLFQDSGMFQTRQQLPHELAAGGRPGAVLYEGDGPVLPKS